MKIALVAAKMRGAGLAEVVAVATRLERRE
jgi:hypothetical protein